jgi:phosphoglycolate phosphatase
MSTVYKTLFFDFDGTLHESMHIYYPAFMKGYAYLVESGHAEARVFTQKEVSQWLGFSSTDMWQTFMPHLPEKVRTVARTLVGDEMLRLLKDKQGVLYPGVYETLQALKDRGHTLVFLSNCGETYMNAASEAFHLESYFDHMICSGQYSQMTKSQILKQLKQTFQEPMAIIGDRFHDMEAGLDNHITTIGCLYGYGQKEEFKDADFLISKIQALLEFI